jgi:hypothetical protein
VVIIWTCKRFHLGCLPFGTLVVVPLLLLLPLSSECWTEPID